ncbi:MAG TPA: molecular chaperone HtpG, partial [Cytophagales bacterium]|nr:molecular chaperone HtpG [Cytophagales bacterium]
HTENIFPIIKKFLYSDHEIFLRELVSNAVDASQKLKKLGALGEYSGEVGELKVKVSIDQEAKTITISDNGIGMTGEEIKKYINQIAFSGATEFVEKFKDKGDVKDIIGKFGLGFYSSFMVADQVEIKSLSYQDGAHAVRWVCDGSTEFELSPIEKNERGTDIILHVNEDSKEFLESYRLQSILEKYCKFLPIRIEYDGKTINKEALWTKAPSELKDEDYLKFYKELYPFSEDPLFWIHLNVDYPFNLTGILYFPKVKNDFELHKNKIQLYSRQVFITDEVKDIVPEFLMLLHGVIDSPDIPLNVSRSYLQADSNVKKINSHITKKVADKLSDLFKNDQSSFENKWESLGLFVKYGMISDEKFYEKAVDFCLLKNIDGVVTPFNQYKDKVAPAQTDKNSQVVWLYSNEPAKQDMFIQSAKRRGYDVLIFDSPIDPHFIQNIERKLEKVNLKRVDSETLDKLVEQDTKKESVLTEKEKNKVQELFEKAINNSQYKVSIEAMAEDELPVSVSMPEFMRRMKETGGLGGMSFMGSFPDTYNVAVNGNHPLIQKIVNEKEEDKKAELAKYAYQLGMLSQNLLSGNELTTFIGKSVEMLASK